MITKFITYSLVASSLLFTQMHAEIVETQYVETILPNIEQDSFVLFNLTEVLTDSEISLGSSPWRKYIRSQTNDTNLHDRLTWLVANRIPHKSVEPVTPQLIENLQNQGIAVAGLTYKGRNEWYTTRQPGVDKLTRYILAQMGIDFRQSSLPFVSIQMEGCPFLEHFNAGIFYSNHMDKGQFVKELLVNSGYKPSSVVMIDDKFESLEEVKAAMKELNIPFHGHWYTRTRHDRVDFSPMVANVQLEALLKKDKILSDLEAQAIVDEHYSDVDPDAFFKELLDLFSED